MGLVIAAGVAAYRLRKSGADSQKLKEAQANVKVAEEIVKARGDQPTGDDLSKRLRDGSWKL